jgi:all-trans-retinol 13,14-reductase
MYWILCGFENILGIVIPFLFSLFLIILQIYEREFNLMDIISMIYFSISLVITFIFKLNIFIEKSGLLGYFALFFMSLFSLIIKRPYTLQVSKRDYPEIYWKDERFLKINNIITEVWTIIFLINALIFFIMSNYVTIIISNTLIVFGIIFSILFPTKAPAYFVSKEFKKYDWNVKIDSKKDSKKENEYDVIIIGSGIGGLTCGALLSKRGYKVLVLEQHYQVGGYCSSFKRKEFVFNTGVEDVSGLWEKGPITYLLKEFGLKKDDLFVRNTMRYIFRCEKIDIPHDLNEFIKLLSERFPEEKENIIAFFNEAKKAYEECYKDSEIYGVPLPAELIVKVFGAKKLLNYPKEHPHFYDWINKTFKQKLDEFFKNEDLKRILSALLAYTGTAPDKTLASSAFTANISYYIYGGYSIKGGAQNFANILKNIIENNNGKVLLNHKVDEILLKMERLKE